MSNRIDISYRIIEYITIPIKRLRITRPKRRSRLLLLLVIHLEPERLLILPTQLSRKAWFVKVHRQGLERHTVHPTAGIPGTMLSALRKRPKAGS